MPIRPYDPTDAEPLLTIFRKHVPHAFAENEVAEWVNFLQPNTDPYYVAEHDGRVVGECGHSVRADGQTVRIGWTFTDPDVKGLGVGSALMCYNPNVIEAYPGIRVVECRTSPVAYRFFKKWGFRLQYTEPDF